MRSLIIFALVLAVFASITEARSVDFNEKSSKEVVKDEAHLAKPDSDINEKIEEEKHRNEERDEHSKDEEREKHSKYEEKDKEHVHSEEHREEHHEEHREEHHADSREKETDGSYELHDNEFIAIIAILIDPDTLRPHLLAHQLPPRAPLPHRPRPNRFY